MKRLVKKIKVNSLDGKKYNVYEIEESYEDGNPIVYKWKILYSSYSEQDARSKWLSMITPDVIDVLEVHS